VKSIVPLGFIRFCVVFFRGTDEGSSRRKRASSDTVANEIKKVLSSIDPKVLKSMLLLCEWD